MRENKEILWGSMVKQTMQRKKPTFNEEYYGYNTFATCSRTQKNKIIGLKKDARSGTYIVLLDARRQPRRHDQLSAGKDQGTNMSKRKRTRFLKFKGRKANRGRKPAKGRPKGEL